MKRPSFYRYRFYLHGLALAALCAVFPVTHKALAETQSVAEVSHFDLPGQALQASLIEFALQAGITVITDTEAVKDYRSSPVVGRYRADDALSSLLSNTSLGFQYHQDTGSFIIRQKGGEIIPAEQPLAVERPVLLPIEELLVSSVSYPFRYHTVTNTQLHSGVSYFDSSRFLNVIPQALIQDQQAADLSDVLKFASGITPGDGIADSNDDIFIRGFQRHAIYLDGFRLSDSTGVKLLPANIERIEVLKGPSTLLYGQAEPGGIVNVVRKRPQAEPFVKAEVGGGSAGQRHVNLDINNQVPGAADIDFRVILADEVQGESAEISDIHRQLIATSATWQLSSDTAVDVGYEYQHAEQTWDRDFAVFLPYEEVFPGANLQDVSKQARPDFSTEFKLFNAELTHYLSPEWRVSAKYFWHDEHRLGVRTSSDTLLKTNIFFKPDELGSDYLLLVPGGQVALPILIDPRDPEWLYSIGKIRSVYDEEAFEIENNISVNLEGSFDTGALTHHLTLGGDWHQQDIFKRYTVEVRDPFRGQVWPDSEFGQVLPEIAAIIFDPDQPLGALETKELRLLYDDYGIYIQDSVELNERWIVSAGSRYSITSGDHADLSDWVFTPLQTYKNFSSQLGLVYKPSDNHSIYMNYSEALRANYHIDDIGSRTAEPELSDQVELGIKSLLFDGQMLSGIALYEIHKKNIVDLEFIDGLRTSLAAHQQQVRGIDADITWQFSSQFDVMGAFSIIDPQITSGKNQGNQSALAAEQTASLFARYEMRSGLELSGGYKYVSKRFADDENIFWLGDYATIDLGIAYPFELFATQSRLQFAIKNLLDEQYYTAILGGVRMNESEGRSMVATLRVEL